MNNSKSYIEFKDRANDDWTMVEMFRWQYGELPRINDDRKVDVVKVLESMSKSFEESAFSSGNYKNIPSPMNVGLILGYCARRLKQYEQGNK